jgi:Ca2+-binding RTX toxin-like protein
MTAAGSATFFGGDGNDSTLNGGNGVTFQNGNAGDDNLDGGTGKDTIYGGQGDDDITSGGGADKLYGSKGDDTITLAATGAAIAEGGADDDYLIAITNNNTKQTLIGGAGDDSFSFLTDTAAGFFTIKGGAGDDTITQAGAGENSSTYDYLYDSFAEFYSSNDLVDTITTNGGATSVEHTFVISGALKFDDSDEISNLTNSGTSTTALVTAKSVTGASSVALDETEAALFDTIDISAGTTGSSKIDLSASTAAHTIKGSKTARNTLSGGTGADTITAGSNKDTITGGAGADAITLGAGIDNFIQGTSDGVLPSEVVADEDAYTFDMGSGADVITDFALEDVIDFGISGAIDLDSNVADIDGALVDGAVTVFRGAWDGTDDFVASTDGDDLFVFVAGDDVAAAGGIDTAAFVAQAIVLEDAGALTLTTANFS